MARRGAALVLALIALATPALAQTVRYVARLTNRNRVGLTVKIGRAHV